VKTVEVIISDKNGNIIYKTDHNLDLYIEYLKRNTNDLTTLWLRRLYIALFTPIVTGHSTSFSFTDTTGTSRTQFIKKNYGSNPSFLETYACPNRFWISYGSSNTTPTITDFKLGNKLNEGIATVTTDESSGIMTFSISFTITSNITVYEVGLEWEGCISSYNICGRFLFDRTVFPDGISVSSGQVLTIIYRILI